MKMYLAGQWVDGDQKTEVINPYSGEAFDTVPAATEDDVATAVKSARRGATQMAALSAHRRYEVLMEVARIVSERKEEFARTITDEEGKILAESRGEVDRCIETIRWSAEEAKRLHGETIHLDAAPGADDKFGFTVRIPVGVIAAITPFNFPLNLVAHKIAPAFAAGNAVINKPASDTPLSALKLTEAFLEAGAPAEAIQCVTGSGGTIGNALVSHPDVRMVTFTGSRSVGEGITKLAGLKKVTMELGSNSPVVVMPGADPEKVAGAIAASGYANAGQSCISTQRVIAHRDAYEPLLSALVSAVSGMSAGDPSAEGTAVGPLVRESDAERVYEWIQEAQGQGARIAAGGERSGSLVTPSVLADVLPEMRVSREELFGPAVAVMPADDVDKAIELANDTYYGLSAAIFTENISEAMKFALKAESGNVNINGGTSFRADMMPYGGVKFSGFGKEGPSYAVEEMTELKMVIFHGVK